MKAKKKLPETTAVPQAITETPISKYSYGYEPCFLVEGVDIPLDPPEIKQSEIVAYATAEDHYHLARIDYEERKWRLVRKLHLMAKCENGSYQVKLDENMRLIIVDSSSTETFTTKLRIL